jgi:glycine oxidase
LTYNVVIIGAGVAGLSVALTLLQRGHRVTLLECGHAGGESSWAGGGILSPLLPWEYPESVTTLALRSMECYAAWVSTIEQLAGEEAEFWRCGMLALEVAAPLHAKAWCTAHGIAVIPNVSPTTIITRAQESTLLLAEIAQVRNPRLITVMRAAIERMGGTLREHCPATGVRIVAGRVAAVQTYIDEVAADSVVLATGAWARIGLTGLSPAPHIRPIRGQMLLFKLEPGALDTIVYRNGLYLIPRRDGHILVGSTLEDVGFDKSTDVPTRQRLHAEAAELLPVLGLVQPIQHWSGLRPGSPDNIPIIDRHPDFDNVFVNTGHYRYGVTMAPASAELLVDLMEGNTPALDPVPYRWQAAMLRHW